MSVLTFTKFAGQELADVPPFFHRWLVSQSWVPIKYPEVYREARALVLANLEQEIATNSMPPQPTSADLEAKRERDRQSSARAAKKLREKEALRQEAKRIAAERRAAWEQRLQKARAERQAYQAEQRARLKRERLQPLVS